MSTPRPDEPEDDPQPNSDEPDSPLPERDRRKGPSFIKEPWSYVKWWLSEKPPTNSSSAAIALWSIFTAGVLTAAASVIIKELGPAGNVPGYVLVIVGGACLTIGVAITWILTRKFYELLVRALKTEVQKFQAEVQLERDKLAGFEPSTETLRRFSVYSDHVYTLVGTLITSEVSLSDLTSEAVSRAVCEVTQTHLLTATGREFKLSIWGEPTDPRIRERISDAMSERLPDAVGELLPAKRKFTILAGPDHTPTERKAFEVPIDPSWLKYNQRQEEQHAEQVVYQADIPNLSALRGDDIEAFTKLGYESVRAISFRRDGMLGYLVMLSKTPHAFSEIEEQYLLWLKRILELDSVIRTDEQ